MKSGQELIIMANTLAFVLSEDANIDELLNLVELLGLLKHNLEVIKTSRILNKVEDKVKVDDKNKSDSKKADSI